MDCQSSVTLRISGIRVTPSVANCTSRNKLVLGSQGKSLLTVLAYHQILIMASEIRRPVRRRGSNHRFGAEICLREKSTPDTSNYFRARTILYVWWDTLHSAELQHVKYESQWQV